MNALLAGILAFFTAASSLFGFGHTTAIHQATNLVSTTTQSTSVSVDRGSSGSNTAINAAASNSNVAVNQSSANTSVTAPVAATAPATTSSLPTGSPWMSMLPLGDGKYVTSAPKKGYIYLCHVASDGQGAEENGPWIQGNYWYPAQKTAVQGNVSWPNAMVNIAVSGLMRVITSNGLPVGGTTGTFPIGSNDPAYAYDQNPNEVEAQNYSFSLPANPTIASAPSCIYGEVGIMTNGVPLLDAFDAEYRDAAAHELQDSCDGHPHESGVYHYHSLSSCISDIDETNVIGYAFDGFPITGPKLPSGNYLTTSDLDECHGITSPIVEDGTTVTTYHYVMTEDFPYSIGCFRGKSYEPKPGPQAQGSSGSTSGSESQQGSAGQQGSGGGGQQPPAAAVSACASSSSGDSCTVSTPNGTITGTCNTPPGSSSLACIPSQQ